MYCPKCSQQQVSEEARFCPRCGFQLGALKALLSEDRDVLASGEAEPRTRLTPARKRDILLGATLMLVGSITVALLTISTIAGTPLQAVIIPLLLVWAALVSALLLSGHAAREAAGLFSKSTSSSPPQSSADSVAQVGGGARHQALPPAQSTPVSGLGSWRSNTAELAEPSSVTERTTSLLDERHSR